jgi:hypothetical protein
MEILLFDKSTNCLEYAAYEIIQLYEDKRKVVCVLEHHAIKTSGTVQIHKFLTSALYSEKC